MTKVRNEIFKTLDNVPISDTMLFKEVLNEKSNN